MNRKIFVVGFGLFGSIHTAAEYAVNVQVMNFNWHLYFCVKYSHHVGVRPIQAVFFVEMI